VVAGPHQALLTGRYACYDLYPCRDGKWLSVGAIEPHFYANLCRALECERFIERQHDDERQDEIRAAFRATFATRDRDDWVSELAPANTCVAPVLTLPEVAANEHFRDRGLFMEAVHETDGVFEQVAPVLAGGDREQPRHVVPDPNATDTVALLSDAGYSPAEIEKLRAEGAVE
jgi:alpha-methylacyl-CoA racemase